MKTLWLGAASAAALICASAPALAANAPDLSQAPRMGPWGFDTAGRDLSVAPSKDFFDYANGGYLNRLEIPADRSRYGAFDALNELSQNRMRAVVEKAAANPAATGEEAKIGAFYRSFVDEAAVEALGAKPLAGDLAAIRALKTRDAMARYMGGTSRRFGGSFFGSYVHDDAKDPEKYAAYMVQGGLGLPDRDYYLDAKFAPQKAAYEAYVTKLLTLAGWEKPAENAKAIVALETEIAKFAAGRLPIKAWLSIPIGVVTLAERFPEGETITEGWYREMVETVKAELAAFRSADSMREVFDADRAHMVGTSGAITSLAGMHLGLRRYDRSQVDGIWMTRDQCDAAANLLLGLNARERAEQPCIGPDRADLVLAGAAILQAVQELWPCTRVRVADRGLREGILMSLMSDAGTGRKRRRRRRGRRSAGASPVNAPE